MIITNINFNEKNSLFTIKINDSETYQISYNLYEDLSLKTGMEIDDESYKIILIEDQYQRAKKIAEKYINYRFRSKNEVRLRLKRENTNEESIQKVIDYYVNLGLLDDDRFAKDYVDYCIKVKNYSKRFTEYKLKEKGIEKLLIDKYLENLDSQIEYENAKILFNKKYRGLDLSDYKNKQKVYRYLSSKGFDYDLINRIMGENE